MQHFIKKSWINFTYWRENLRYAEVINMKYSILRNFYFTKNRTLQFFTDGNKQNIAAIHTHFPAGSVNYGVKKRVYQGQNIVGIVHRKVLGNPSRKEIAINHVDGLCSKLRERVSCFTRKARTFAKRSDDLNHRLEIFAVSHNLIEKKRRLTPAMREGLAAKPLNWSKILHTRLSILK